MTMVEMTRVEVEAEVEVEVARPNAERKMTVTVHEAEGAVFQEGLSNDGLGPIKSVNKKNEAYVPGQFNRFVSDLILRKLSMKLIIEI